MHAQAAHKQAGGQAGRQAGQQAAVQMGRQYCPPVGGVQAVALASPRKQGPPAGGSGEPPRTALASSCRWHRLEVRRRRRCWLGIGRAAPCQVWVAGWQRPSLTPAQPPSVRRPLLAGGSGCSRAARKFAVAHMLTGRAATWSPGSTTTLQTWLAARCKACTSKLHSWRLCLDAADRRHLGAGQRPHVILPEHWAGASWQHVPRPGDGRSSAQTTGNWTHLAGDSSRPTLARRRDPAVHRSWKCRSDFKKSQKAGRPSLQRCASG